MIDQAWLFRIVFHFFGIAGDKGLTLLIAKLDQSLAMIGDPSGVHVAWPICFRLIPRFVFGSGVRRQFEELRCDEKCVYHKMVAAKFMRSLTAPVYMTMNKLPSRSRCKAVVLRM